jgi:hypothetical protein
MNLSHYQSLDPDMNDSDGQKRGEARREPLPAHGQAAVLFLKPGKGPLGLEAGHVALDRSSPWGLVLPDPFGNLCPDASGAELLTQGFGVIAFVRRKDLQALPGAPPLAGLQPDRIQQGDHLGPLVAIGWGRTGGQGHTRGLGQAMDENPLALPPRATPSPPPLPGGKRAINSPVPPANHATFLSHAEDPGLHPREGPIRLPALQPPVRRALRGPLGTAGDIAPAAAGDENVQQGIHHRAKGHMRHATPARCGLRGKQVQKELPFQVAQPFEASGHSSLLQGKGTITRQSL